MCSQRRCYSNRLTRSAANGNSHRNILSHEEFVNIREASVAMSEQAVAEMWKDLWQPMDNEWTHADTASTSKQNHRNHSASEMTKQNDESEKNKAAAALRERAIQLQDEEQDEIRRLNTLILEAKCLAGREAQIREKCERERDELEKRRQLERKVESEQMRIEMEREAVKAKKAIETLNFAEEIKKQIENQKQLKKESRQKLSKWEAENLEKRIQQHVSDKQREKEKRIKAQNEFKANLKESVELKKEQIRLSEEREAQQMEKLKALNALREANEVESKTQKEKLKQEAEMKKKEVFDKWMAKQDQLKEEQIKSETQRKETVEMLDREWRNEELKKAQIGWQMRRKLQDEWALQIEAKNKILQAKKNEEIAKDIAIIRADEAKVCEDERRKREYRANRELQKQQLQQQMEKQAEARRELKSHLQAEMEDDQRQQMKRHHTINEIRQRKLEELRSAKIPEKHVQNVDRRSRKDFH